MTVTKLMDLKKKRDKAKADYELYYTQLYNNCTHPVSKRTLIMDQCYCNICGIWMKSYHWVK